MTKEQIEAALREIESDKFNTLGKRMAMADLLFRIQVATPVHLRKKTRGEEISAERIAIEYRRPDGKQMAMMRAEEWSDAITFECEHAVAEKLKSLVAIAIDVGRAEMRESCAVLIEQIRDYTTRSKAADAIRAMTD